MIPKVARQGERLKPRRIDILLTVLRYRDACRSFWSEQQFYLYVKDIDKDERKQNAFASFMRRISDKDMAYITDLRIYVNAFIVDQSLLNGLWHQFGIGLTWETLPVPPTKIYALIDAGFIVQDLELTSYAEVNISTDVRKMNDILGRSGLTKDELVAVVEEVAGSRLPNLHTWRWDCIRPESAKGGSLMLT